MPAKTLEVNRATFMSLHDMMRRMVANFDDIEAEYQRQQQRDQQALTDERANAQEAGAAHLPQTQPALYQPSSQETQLEAVTLTRLTQDWEPDDDDWSDEALAVRFGQNGFGR